MQGSVSGVLEKQTDVFGEGLGMLKGTTATIYVVSDQPPKYFKPGSVRYAVKRKIEKELDRLVQTTAIEPLRYSDWATPIVSVLKAEGKVRVCGDYKLTVNRVSHLEQYPIPTLDDLCVINTHKGLFRYNRLPYGISSEPAIFHISNLSKFRLRHRPAYNGGRSLCVGTSTGSTTRLQKP